jgi:L-Ala-D/L-Glu epimerase
VRFELQSISARLHAPFVSAADSVETRRLVCVRVTGDDGISGNGEAAPLEGYDGVSLDAVIAALEDCRPLIEASDGSHRADLLAACARAAVLPQALAAIDLALWDLDGRRQGKPVWRLLGAAAPESVAVNATIAAADRASAAAIAAEALAQGFGCVKVKAGLGDDPGRVAAVRAAGGAAMAIRLDANGAWSVAEAVATLTALAPAGIELCEEPVSGLEQNARVAAATPIPIALDESGALPGALDRRICDAVCLKITRCGGITGIVTAAAAARAAGYRVYLASTLDGPLGIAAALHAATVVKPDLPCGLATLGQFAGRQDPLPAISGQIALPGGSGLGDGLLGWYER